MAELQEFKCPCCGGGIEFDPTLQKMKCPYCDTEFELETLQGYDNDLKNEKADDMTWDTNIGGEWQEGETEGLRVYICNSCGGEIVGDATTGATACPFCDNPIVMQEQFDGVMRPDYVIPFKLDKKAAKEGFKRHLQGKKLLPSVFKDEAHIEEIKGIYVPFWLFDTEAQANMRYRGTRLRTWSDRNYIYTETKFYSIHRGGSLEFAGVPVDGSSKMSDDLMESIEPFDLKDKVDFQTAYLAGYLADKYDVSSEESVGRANERIRRSTERAFAETVQGYASVVPEHSSIQLKNGQAKYTLCPVWILNTVWKDQRYVFAMNGQTGKFVGDLPVDKKAYWKYFFRAGATGSAISLALFFLGWLAGFL